MKSLFEDVASGTMIYINILKSSDVETNIVMYGMDKSGETTTPKKGVYADPLGMGTSGKEEFVDIKEQKSTPWKLATEWVLQALNDAGFDPMVNPDKPKLHRMLMDWMPPSVSKTRAALAMYGKLKTHYRRCKQCWDSGVDESARLAAAAVHTRIIPDEDDDPERAAQLSKDAKLVSKDLGDDEDKFVFQDEELSLQPLGNQGYEILVSNKSKDAGERRTMKAGVRYVLEILTAPGLNEESDGGAANSVATNRLYQILKTTAPSWVLLSMDDTDIIISAKMEEIGYPQKIYLGSDWEEVSRLEQVLNNIIHTYSRGKDTIDAIKFDHLPNRQAVMQQLAHQLGCGPTEDSIKQALQTKLSELRELYAKAEKDGLVVDPHTRAGRVRVKEHSTELHSAGRSEGSKRGAATRHEKHFQPRWNKEFRKHIERIMGEAINIGIPAEWVEKAITAYLRKYVGIGTIAEFDALTPAVKQNAIKKLKELRYAHLHGIWESIQRLAIARHFNDHRATALYELRLNNALNAVPVPENGVESKAMQLSNYVRQINGMKQYLLENANVYAALLKKSGFKNVRGILESYGLEYDSYDENNAEVLADCDVIVSEARNLFAHVAKYVGAQNVRYLEYLAPSNILDDSGYIDDSTFIESAKESGVNMAEIYATKNIPRVRSHFMEKLT